MTAGPAADAPARCRHIYRERSRSFWGIRLVAIRYRCDSCGKWWIFRP